MLEKVSVRRPTISNLDTSTDSGHPDNKNQDITPPIQPEAGQVTTNSRSQPVAANNSRPMRKRKRIQPANLPLQGFNESQTVDFHVGISCLLYTSRCV